MGTTGLLDCPGELVDLFAQLLPGSSFLVLRATCKDLQQKTKYHFTHRYLRNKSVVLTKDSCVSLNSLVELASQPDLAYHVRKVCLEVEDDSRQAYSLLLVRQILDNPVKGSADWTRHFYTPPSGAPVGVRYNIHLRQYPDQPVRDRFLPFLPQEPGPESGWPESTLADYRPRDSMLGPAVDIGLVCASLGALPSLEVVEIKQKADPSASSYPLGPKAFLSKLWCFKCKMASQYGQCLHYIMFCKAISALAETKHDLQRLYAFFNISPGTSGSITGLNVLSSMGGSQMILHPSFQTLREIKVDSNPRSLYAEDPSQVTLLGHISRNSPQLQKFSLRGAGEAYRIHTNQSFLYNYIPINPSFVQLPRFDHWKPEATCLNPGSLTTFSLRSVNVCWDSISNLLSRHVGTLRNLSLDGIMMTQSINTLLDQLPLYTKLEVLYIRAPFMRRVHAPTPLPVIFGDQISEAELLDFILDQSRARHWTPERADEWRKEAPNVPDMDRDRDLVGWKFEGLEILPGVKFLMENARQLHPPGF